MIPTVSSGTRQKRDDAEFAEGKVRGIGDVPNEPSNATDQTEDDGSNQRTPAGPKPIPRTFTLPSMSPATATEAKIKMADAMAVKVYSVGWSDRGRGEQDLRREIRDYTPDQTRWVSTSRNPLKPSSTSRSTTVNDLPFIEVAANIQPTGKRSCRVNSSLGHPIRHGSMCISLRISYVPMGSTQPTVKLEEYMSGVARNKSLKGRRLVLSKKGKQGMFRVVLYPFRTTVQPAGANSRQEWEKWPLGADIPEFGNPAAVGFWLKFPTYKHEWRFTAGTQGRTRATLQRGAERLRLE